MDLEKPRGALAAESNEPGEQADRACPPAKELPGHRHPGACASETEEEAQKAVARLAPLFLPVVRGQVRARLVASRVTDSLIRMIGEFVGAPWSVFAGGAVFAAVLDKLDKRGVTTEYLRYNARVEQNFLDSCPPSPDAALSARQRMVIITCVWNWVQMMSFHSPRDTLAAAIVRFDAYCARKRPRRPVEELPEVAMAIVRLLQKEANAAMSLCNSGPVLLVNRLQEVLVGMDLPARRVTEDMLIEAELDFLTVLEWKTNLPNPQKYVDIFDARLDSLTDGALSQSLERAKARARNYVFGFQMLQEARADLSARAVSIGLFAFFMLLGSRLLPVRALKPRGLDADAWERLVAESEMIEAEVPCCDSPPLTAQELLQYVEWSTDSALTDIKKFCGKVVEAVRNAVLADRARMAAPAVRVW